MTKDDARAHGRRLCTDLKAHQYDNCDEAYKKNMQWRFTCSCQIRGKTFAIYTSRGLTSNEIKKFICDICDKKFKT